MSRKFTQGIKGLAILLVFTMHIAGQMGVPYVQFIAGTGVSLFLILSGYGIECSFRQSGLKWFWLKKILTVIIPYWIVIIVAGIYFHYSNESMINGFLMLSASWYIPYILGCYLIFWITGLLAGGKSFKTRFTVVCILFFIWFILECIFRDSMSYSSLRIRQMMCFPTGMWLCDNWEKLFKMDSKKKQLFIGIAMSVVGMIFTVLCQVFTWIFPLLHGIMALFSVYLIGLGALTVFILISKVFENRVLGFLGLISYEIFIVHWQVIDYAYPHLDGIGRFLIFTFVGVTIVALFDRIVLDRIKKVFSVSKKTGGE